MTVLLAGDIRMAPGQAAAARAMLAEHMAVVATEEGCEFYSFAFDAAEPDTIRISERWASAAALAAHGRQPHQLAFREALKAFAPLEVTTQAWTAEPLER